MSNLEQDQLWEELKTIKSELDQYTEPNDIPPELMVKLFKAISEAVKIPALNERTKNELKLKALSGEFGNNTTLYYLFKDL